MQLDVTSSQLLVTDGVFRDKGFRQQLYCDLMIRYAGYSFFQ